MKAEQLQLGLRPRPMFEAVDLGVRLAQDSFASLRRAYLPLGLLLVLACGSTMELAPWLPCVLLWWSKPWLDRALLHVYARKAFGESTGFADAWAARGEASWSQLLGWLTLWRPSFRRAYVMPVLHLEGQSGKARRSRLRAVMRGHLGSSALVQFVFAQVELSVCLGLVSLGVWLVPGLRDGDLLDPLVRGGPGYGLALYGAQALATLFVEPFYVAAGFAMYLNRRVELEAWDIEQELRHAFAPA